MKEEEGGVWEDERLGSNGRVSCMAGIFQLFDCQQLLGQGHRRETSGHTTKKNQIRRFQVNPRDSMESSRTSFSSSCTSFSSFEYKLPEEEQMYTHQSSFSRTPRNSPRSPAFEDVIKDSIYKELQTAEDDSRMNRMMKPGHSQRITNLCKFNDHDESLRILFEHKESSRCSYDGTDSQTFTDMKQAGKYKELSRLSTDGKEDPSRCNSSPKFNSMLKFFDKNDNGREVVAMNRLHDMEINQKSPNIVAKLMGLEPLLDEGKHNKPLQSPRNNANMTKKVEFLVEKRSTKDQFQHSSTELEDLRRAIMEMQKNGNKKSTKYKWNTESISEEAFKTPIVIMEPARKFEDSFSKIAELEGPPTCPGKIRTSCSNNRKKDVLNVQIKNISPPLQQIKSDIKKKGSDSIPPDDTNRSLRRLENSQSTDSVSPRSKLRQKPIQIQDIELQNSGEQANRCLKYKCLFRESVQELSNKVSTRASVSDDKKHSMTLKEQSAKELELIVSQRQPCPNSIRDALLKKDGLPPPPMSDVFDEYQDLPSDHNFDMECVPQTRASQTRASTLSSRNNHSKQASIGKISREANDLGRTTNAHATELFQASSHLQKESDLLSMLDQVNSDSRSKSTEKSYLKKVDQKLISDIVNELLEQKIAALSSHDYKIKCYQNCKGRKDEHSLIHKKMLQQPQVWDRSKSEVPVIVLEIERLIFKDLINEVVNG